jgi:hypothetical protein
MAKKTYKRSRRSRRRTIRRHRSKRGGGIGATAATWPPDNSAFGRKVGSPVNTDNIGIEGKSNNGKD